MEKLKLNMLLNTCQNQWKNVISHNEDFKACIFGPNGHLIDLDANYTDKDEYYQYRNLEVAYWKMKDKNTLIVELTW